MIYIMVFFVNNPMFWPRETEEKVVFFKIFLHILLLLTIEELMLVVVTSHKTSSSFAV